jgi:recombinational DNA repair protein (RecF pathway)
MREYVTEAIVLKKEPVREFDTRLSLYTRELGKVRAVATSARKPLSKLSPHVEPLSIVEVRLAEKGGMQLTDALRKGTLPKKHIGVLALLDTVLETGERDDRLWSLLTRDFNLAEVLSVLGFDPNFAVCESCGNAEPDTFLFKDAEYLCARCVPYAISREEYVVLPPRVKPGIL